MQFVKNRCETTNNFCLSCVKAFTLAFATLHGSYTWQRGKDQDRSREGRKTWVVYKRDLSREKYRCVIFSLIYLFIYFCSFICWLCTFYTIFGWYQKFKKLFWKCWNIKIICPQIPIFTVFVAILIGNNTFSVIIL